MTASIPTKELTESKLDGKGVFDELMRATKAHIHEEYTGGRLKGADYAQVYLSSVNAVLQQSMQFLLERERAYQQAELIKAQVVTESKQQALLDQQLLNAQAEEDLLKKQTDKVVGETALVAEQVLNAKRENELMQRQICKLEAEFDVLIETKAKTIAETTLLNQKKRTEEAQTNGSVASPDSVVGVQNALYVAQSEGYKRDAEQKAAKILVDAWSVARTTDETGVGPNDANRLNDVNIGRAMNRLLTGVGA